MQTWWQKLLWGNANSVYPIGCLTLPVMILYPLYLWIKNWFVK